MLEVSRCPLCRGFDGSLDVSSGKFICNNCEYKGANKKIEWGQYIEEYENKMRKDNGNI